MTDPDRRQQHATDRLGAGVHTRTETFTRAHLPDGRIQDSPVQTLPLSFGATIGKLASMFGRQGFPPGTRFEQFERTATTTVTEWAPVATAEDGAA